MLSSADLAGVVEETDFSAANSLASDAIGCQLPMKPSRSFSSVADDEDAEEVTKVDEDLDSDVVLLDDHDSNDDDNEKRSEILADLRAIVTSILTGRVSPVTLTVLSLRYVDVRGCAIPIRSLGCTSLVEVFQKHFADELSCSYMHYYKDYVVWMKDAHLSRDTVIFRLKLYQTFAQRRAGAPSASKYTLQRISSLRRHPFKSSSGSFNRLFAGQASSVTSSGFPKASTVRMSRDAIDVLAKTGVPRRYGSHVSHLPLEQQQQLQRQTSSEYSMEPTAMQLDVSRTLKRPLSSASTLILPVQRMRISDEPIRASMNSEDV